MSITLFGTCRINGVKNNNNLNNLVNYTHSTKEVIQQIKFLSGAISYSSPFDMLCCRTAIIDNKPIVYTSEINKVFNESNICIIEICSEKTYIYENHYLHHLSIDKRVPFCTSWITNTPKIVLDNYICVKQTHTEIENDILEIKKLIEPRKMVLVTHYNAKINGQHIPSRNNLITFLMEISEKYDIPVINPSEALKDYTQEEIMKSDLGHYTQLGLNKFFEYLNDFINKIV